MTEDDVAKMVRTIARDLRLSPEQRYELANAANVWRRKSDAEVRQEAHAAASRATDATLGGAMALLSTAMRETRFMDSLTAAERSRYEAPLFDAHASATDAAADVEQALADAAAHDVAGRPEHAKAIRAAVDRHRAAQRRADGDEG